MFRYYTHRGFHDKYSQYEAYTKSRHRRFDPSVCSSFSPLVRDPYGNDTRTGNILARGVIFSATSWRDTEYMPIGTAICLDFDRASHRQVGKSVMFSIQSLVRTNVDRCIATWGGQAFGTTRLQSSRHLPHLMLSILDLASCISLKDSLVSPS